MAIDQTKQTQRYLTLSELKVGSFYKVVNLFYLEEFCFKLIKRKKGRLIIRRLDENYDGTWEFYQDRRFLELTEEDKAELL
jgi:hypothetical protein